MEEIKWYNVPKWAKCYMKNEEWEQIFKCLWVDWAYLRWEDEKWNLNIGQFDTYMIDVPYNWMVYEKLL